MKSNTRWAITIGLLLILPLAAYTQKTKRTPVAHEKEVRDIVAFLEYMLNTLGDATTSARDKDVLVTESFTKIFRDSKVQIEDDLDEERTVITNKDVQAYLKDVDFFFKDAKFEFTIEDIQSNGTEKDKLFYKVTLSRNLKATTLDGRSINNTLPRFIEINYNANDQDLKVVSIYTNQFNEKGALSTWWNQLSYEWQAIFKRKLNLTDSVYLDDIKAITSIDTLDLSNNRYIQSIEPLSQLLDLSVLNLSTTNINDLTPIRNLTELIALDLSSTTIEDISPLRYSNKLTTLNISHTSVNDITVLEKLLSLQHLQMEGSSLGNFDPLKNLSNLQYLNVAATKISELSAIDSLITLAELNISKTSVKDLNAVQNLQDITALNLDSTHITNLNALSSLKKLKILHINHTAIASLQPLQNLNHLEKIYCDHTNIDQSEANGFMESNPEVLVIFDSEDLRGWWSDLSSIWKDILSRAARVSLNPTNEELATVTNLDSINIGQYVSIKNIMPLKKLQKLKVVIANRTEIIDLSPLKDHQDIMVLDISGTRITDVSILSQFTKLRVLMASHSGIQDIDTLGHIQSLQKLYVDETAIQDEQVQQFLLKNSHCLVIYKTTVLEKWWHELSDDWKQIFQMQIKLNPQTFSENIHQLIELEKIQFSDVPVTDLSPLQVFIRLKELRFKETGISNLSPLANLRSIKSLSVNDNPIREIEPLKNHEYLENLDISNTPVDELEALENLSALTNLNCAGTQVKKLNSLESLEKLEYFDCSNTDVKSLKPLMNLPLKTLKCYNTKVSSGQIKSFKKRHPDCNVIFYR